ncbi:MAG TPA: septal ring lytic transglycosylase RlpA family protein [Alphaproteobacteria bacterium]|nr:septal ring lytic transglycosylase RlpA family protein [Alphaproteobacteria bacterium]
MRRRQLLFAVVAACKVLMLMHMHAEANRWGSSHDQVGWASWYGKRFHGRETASGERFSVMQLTAAHRDLPLGTKVIVMNIATNEAVEVRINDRGPFAETKRRIIDLSRAAADTISLLHRGVGPVRVLVSEEAPELRDASDGVLYEVQVGAFVEIEQANEFLSQLQGLYPSVYITTRDGPLGRYHRVRIGPYETRYEAQEVLNALMEEGYYAFLDEVPASSFLERLQMADETARQELAPSQSEPDGLHVREGIAFRFDAIEEATVSRIFAPAQP